VFNRFEAERWLLLARDVPGHDLRLILKPAGTGAGEMLAEVSLERTPVVLDLSVQNLSAGQDWPLGRAAAQRDLWPDRHGATAPACPSTAPLTFMSS
jgi:hypothetical protein